MSKPLLLTVRFTLFGALVLWGLLALANLGGAISLLERTLVPDGRIQDRAHAVYIVGAVLLGLAFIGPAVLERWRSALTDLARGSWWTEGSEVLLVFALVLIHAAGIVYYDFSPNYAATGIYQEDALLENLTVLLAIGAAVLLLIGLPRSDRPSQIFAGLLAIAAILFAGEEISWGQRIFGFESTGVFAKANYQGETNLHNFSLAIHQICTMLVFSVAIWLVNSRTATRWLVTRVGCADIQPLVSPLNNLILATVMFGLGLHCAIYGSELSEEVLALILFYGSLRFMLARRAGRSPPGLRARGEASAFFEGQGRVEELVQRAADAHRLADAFLVGHGEHAGEAASTKAMLQLGSAPNAVEAPENSFAAEVTCAWTSSPITTSHSPVAPWMR